MASNRTYKDSRILVTGGGAEAVCTDNYFTGSRKDNPRQHQPKVALADGLKETIAYFRRSLELS